MIKIPNQLQDLEFRFILLKEKEKNPLEGIKWLENNYKYNDEILIKHLEDNKNYGIIGGFNNLRIIDIDNKILGKKLIDKLNTFTVKTCGGNYHFYIKSDYNINFNFKNSLGEYRANNLYVVAPGSYVIDKKKNHEGDYQVIKDIEIREINKEELFKLLKNIIKEKDSIETTKHIIVDKNFINNNIIPYLANDVSDLILKNKSIEELKKLNFPSRSERDARVITHLLLNGFGQYIKSIFDIYPIGDKYREHPSSIEYLEKTIENSRRYSGVKDDVVLVLEKEIYNSIENVLRNKIDYFLKRISSIDNWLMQQYLISIIAFKVKINKRDLLKRLTEVKNLEELKNPISALELLKSELPSTTYYLYPILPKNSLILVGGKPGSFKSMFVLSMLLTLRNGGFFIEKFGTLGKPKVLLYDLENDINTLYWRFKYIINGLEKKDENSLKEFHIEKKFNKNNMVSELNLSKNYDIIVLDSYRRFLEGAEDKSDVTDKFYHEFLAPLKEMGKTIIIVHHFKKSKLDDLSEDDIMDLFRGSSDIPAQVDIMYALFKGIEISTKISDSAYNSSFDIYCHKTKNRLGLPIKHFTFKVVKNDELLTTKFKFLDFKKLLSPKEKAKEIIVEMVLEKGEVKRDDIVKYIQKLLELTPGAIDKYLKELLEERKLTQPRYGLYTVL